MNKELNNQRITEEIVRYMYWVERDSLPDPVALDSDVPIKCC